MNRNTALAAAVAAPFLGLLAVVPAAQAHIVLAEPAAEAGAYYAGFFRVSHGCDGSPTVSVRIEIPEGIVSAKPQPKPGWELSVEVEALDPPVAGEGGPIASRVSAITWTGNLPDSQFDMFGVMMKLPDAAGPLYFPTLQTCESGERAWTQIPGPGQAWSDMESPAPVLTLSGGAGGGHQGH